MREIMFRGKRTDGKGWMYGYYSFNPTTNIHWIRTPRTTYWDEDMIAPSTVGQYTGLKDKNGKRIFEGDIVAQNWYDYDEPRDDSFGKVVFCEYDCSFSVMDVNKDGFMPLGRCGSYHWEVEVIGNIHDNPELLKGGEG